MQRQAEYYFVPRGCSFYVSFLRHVAKQMDMLNSYWLSG